MSNAVLLIVILNAGRLLLVLKSVSSVPILRACLSVLKPDAVSPKPKLYCRAIHPWTSIQFSSSVG